MDKNYIRNYILMRYKLHIPATDILNEFKLSLDGHAPSLRTIQRWISRFKAGNESIEDSSRSGCPITRVIPANIKRVENLIKDNPYITYAEIKAITNLYDPSIHTILHDHLNLRKLNSRWIPHDLSEEQKRKRVMFCKKNLDLFSQGKLRLCDMVTGDESWFWHKKIGKKSSNASWVKKGEKARVVVRPHRFQDKTLVCVFFTTGGAIHVDYVNRGTNIDHKYYIKNCLEPLIKAIKMKRKKSGTKMIKLLHDNARPHTHKAVIKYLKEQKISTIDHPPYSPDLAPCDFWLFDHIKQRLVDSTGVQSLKTQITAILRSIPKDEYFKTFNKWLERMQLCINNHGEYFEHLIK